MARTKRRDLAELIWLAFDKLTNEKAVMHYRRQCLTDLLTTLTYAASTNDQWARPACPLVSSSKTKPCQFSYVALNALLDRSQVGQHLNTIG